MICLLFTFENRVPLNSALGGISGVASFLPLMNNFNKMEAVFPHASYASLGFGIMFYHLKKAEI